MPPADDEPDNAGVRAHDAVTDPARLRAVRLSGLVDAGPEEVYGQFTRLAGQLLGTPLALLTVVDDRYSTWKAGVGVGADRQCLVEESVCRLVVDGAATVAIGDTSSDARTKDSSAICSMGIRAWAGSPLMSPDGHVLGSFAVADLAPRAWTPLDLETLRVLSGAATAQIAARGRGGPRAAGP